MTIQSPTTRVAFQCNGVSTVFPVAIQAYHDTDFLVLLTTAAGVTSILIEGSMDNYTMAPSGSLQPPFWTLTTTAVYPTGDVINIILNPTQTQLSQYTQGQAFPSLVLQTDLDRLTQMVLRIQDQLNRSIVAPDGDFSPLMGLPSAQQRRNCNLNFDASGNVTLSVTVANVTLTPAQLAFLNGMQPDGALVMAGTTGGDQGAGTVNTQGIFVNGVAISTIAVSAHKTGTTSRTATTPLPDPDLQISLLSPHTYLVSAYVNVQSASPGGIQCFMFYAGGESLAWQASWGRVNGATFLPINNQFGSFNYGGSACQVGDFAIFTAVVTTTSAATLALSWGQTTNNATATSVGPGSYLTATIIN